MLRSTGSLSAGHDLTTEQRHTYVFICGPKGSGFALFTVELSESEKVDTQVHSKNLLGGMDETSRYTEDSSFPFSLLQAHHEFRACPGPAEAEAAELLPGTLTDPGEN